MVQFEKATKTQARLRMAIISPSGGGKTYTALKVAAALGKRVALIDTERGSASKYAHEFNFDVLELTSFDPRLYIEAIKAAQAAGYDVLIIDSLSHAWAGTDGLLEQHDRVAKKMKSRNTWAAWRDVTPIHNQLIDAMLQADLHIIATMRVKTEYVVEKDDEGKMVPKKVGLAPVQRAGMEYEFDVVADMDLEHNFMVSKTRCSALDQATIKNPDGELSQKLLVWLSDGAPPVAKIPEEGTGQPKVSQKRPQKKTAPPLPPHDEKKASGGQGNGKAGGDFWGFVHLVYKEKMGYTTEQAKAAGENALEAAGGDKERARWLLLLEMHALDEGGVEKALGVPVQKWLAAEEGRTLEGAIVEVLAVAG